MELARCDSAQAEFDKPGTVAILVAALSDGELERSLLRLVAVESEATGDVVAHIGEFERRRLFAPKSLPSMFEYCTRTLGYSEGAAYLRIYAGRLSLEYPEIVDRLRDRRLHLTAVRIIGPHLHAANAGDLLARCLSKTARELKFVVAGIAPRVEQAQVIRRLPNAAEVPSPPEPLADPATRLPVETVLAFPREPTSPREHMGPIASPPARIEPTTPTRVRFAFTGSDEFLRKVDRSRELLRHRSPGGALEDIFAAAIDCFLDVHDPARKKLSARRRETKRRARKIPQWVKDAVFARDGGRCAFRSAEGSRCEERGGLQYDHIVPWAKGGASDDPANVRLLCRAHNLWEAERIFGRRFLRRVMRAI
jgi:5-methylcytosine-specific restriction endonuclease McrA